MILKKTKPKKKNLKLKEKKSFKTSSTLSPEKISTLMRKPKTLANRLSYSKIPKDD
jgi:hypothetical protein